jgi:hypothetical protein
MGGAVGLDFNAPLALAAALGADAAALGLVADCLPAAEGAILTGLRDDNDGDGE